MFVWAGDSTGITVNMKSGKLGPRTPNHVPDAPAEAARLELLAAVGAALGTGALPAPGSPEWLTASCDVDRRLRACGAAFVAAWAAATAGSRTG